MTAKLAAVENPWEQHKPNVLRQFVGYTYGFQLLNAFQACIAAALQIEWPRSLGELKSGPWWSEPGRFMEFERLGLGVVLVGTMIVYYHLVMELDRSVSYRTRHFLWDMSLAAMCLFEGRALQQPVGPGGFGAAWVVSIAICLAVVLRLRATRIDIERLLQERLDAPVVQEDEKVAEQMRVLGIEAPSAVARRRVETDQRNSEIAGVTWTWALVVLAATVAAACLSVPRYDTMQSIGGALVICAAGMYASVSLAWMSEIERKKYHGELHKGVLDMRERTPVAIFELFQALWLFSLVLACLLVWKLWGSSDSSNDVFAYVVAHRGFFPFSVLTLGTFVILIVARVRAELAFAADRAALEKAMASVSQAK